MLRTKIVCTIGPASREPEMLEKLIKAGMDVARMNLSHGDHAYHTETIQRVREAAKRVGKAVAVLADLQGPKLRVGQIPGAGLTLLDGHAVLLTADPEALAANGPSDDALVIPVQFRRLAQAVSAGHRILLDDGLIELVVEAVTPAGVRCCVQTGGLLTSNKGINLPKAALSIPAITEKDKEDLRFALEHQADWIALSFVRRADEVRELKTMIKEMSPFGRMTPVIAKIEKPEAVDNIDSIMAAADGIMVARGDLGIETSPEAVPMMQKMIIQKCNQAGIPVITATQMLDSMIRNPRPTRAEASDVANAILDGTDAIMLSGETAVSKYALQAVQTMARIAEQAEQAFTAAHRLPPPITVQNSISWAVCHAAADTVYALGASAIIAPTVSGSTARTLSQMRPPCPIIAITPSATVQHQLTLFWGVEPMISRRAETTDEVIKDALKVAWDAGLVAEGETIVITAGSAGSLPGVTDLIRVHRLPRTVTTGEGVGTAVVVGRLRRLEGPLNDDVRVDYNEIVVTSKTDRSFVRPLRGAAGLISADGGANSHCRLLAVELGLPAIVGASDIEQLVDGQWVTLYPKLGVAAERSDVRRLGEWLAPAEAP
jgi:pyruvate kinase